MQLYRETLPGGFKMIKVLWRLDLCVFLFEKCIICRNLFPMTKSLLIKLAFLAKTVNQ